MATITELQDKLAKYEADIQKRMDRIAKLEQKELKLKKKLEDLGVTIPEFDKYVRSSYAKKPNSMGHYNYTSYFSLRDVLSAEDWSIIFNKMDANRATLWEPIYDYEHAIQDQLSSWNKIFEIEDKITNVQIKLQQEQVKQSEVEEIPPILQDLKQNVYEYFINRYNKYRERAKKIQDKIYQICLLKKEYRKEEMDALYLVYGDLVSDYERWVSMTDNKLENEAKRSAESYVLDLIRRVTKKIGNIIDYSDLTVNGPALNGRIVGDRGSTYVETIVAGGYNIQREHLRVILH